MCVLETALSSGRGRVLVNEQEDGHSEEVGLGKPCRGSEKQMGVGTYT